MTEKVQDFIEISPFKKYVDFSDLDKSEKKEKLANEYVITEEVHKHLISFLNNVWEIRKGAEKTLLIVGSYGTGKSYFLAFSCLILESLLDDNLFKIIHSKLEKKKDIWRPISQLKTKGLKLLPVTINMKGESETESIYGIIIKNLKRAVKEYLGEDLKLAYEWDELIDIVQNRMKKEDQNRLLKILENKGYSLNIIIDRLKGRDYEAIKILTEVFTEEFGFPPQLIPLDIKTIYEQALRILKKDFDGIVIFIDELQKYLESSRKVESDLTYLESMCEEAEGKPIILMVSVLERELAKKYNWGKTYDKFVSRFKPLMLTLEGLEEIIKSRLKFRGDLQEKLNKEASAKILKNDNFKLLLSLYPLNPITFRVLRKVAEIRAADRSAFTFLLDIYSKIGTMPFIGDDGKLTLINPDKLYDYFNDDLASYSSESPHVVNEVNNLLSIVKDERKPYVKYMGLTTIMYDQFTRTDLSQAFLDEDDSVQKFMEEIIGSRPRSFETIKRNEIYAIRPIKGAIENTIEEFKKNVTNPLGNLLEDLNSCNLNITSIKIQGVERNLQIKFCLLKDAEMCLKTLINEEVRLLVIIPETEIHLKDADILKLLTPANDRDIILFVMKQRISNLENLREYFAIKQAVKQGKLLETDVKSILSNTEISFKSLFANDNFGVWYKGNKIGKGDSILVDEKLRVSSELLENSLKEVFKRLYPKYFELHKKFKGDVDFTNRRWTNNIIRSFFNKGIISGPSSTITWIRNLVQPIGFAEERGDKFCITLPKETEVGIQRKIIDDIFTKINEHDLIKLYNFLSKPPYGFPDPLIEIYLVGLLANRKILIKDKAGQLIKINLANPSEIKDLIVDSKKGTEYYVYITRVFPNEKWLLFKEFLNDLLEKPIDALKDKTVTEDQILELKSVLDEMLAYYKEKLQSMIRFHRKYDVEISRIRKKSKINGEGN